MGGGRLAQQFCRVRGTPCWARSWPSNTRGVGNPVWRTHGTRAVGANTSRFPETENNTFPMGEQPAWKTQIYYHLRLAAAPGNGALCLLFPSNCFSSFHHEQYTSVGSGWEAIATHDVLFWWAQQKQALCFPNIESSLWLCKEETPANLLTIKRPLNQKRMIASKHWTMDFIFQVSSQRISLCSFLDITAWQHNPKYFHLHLPGLFCNAIRHIYFIWRKPKCR